MLPTTTIGSFPQTSEVRKARAALKKGKWSPEQYEAFCREEIERTVRFQEEIDLDVLVHGECERADMVEYFGEQLEGFAFTTNGWVQSFGTRCVKPPMIFGDVSRPRPMTVRWSQYAKSLTSRPMKGMLTGPITILQWSFVRDDQPRRDTAFQIALAVRDEVADLEAAGIGVIQIDEPALREGLPLAPGRVGRVSEVGRRGLPPGSSGGVRDETQIHTHMCYAEFNDIIESIAAMDADVISIEASRSDMELLSAFVKFKYPNEIGPGVYDIHSPRVPETEEIMGRLRKALRAIPAEMLWVNPDCGLKTRGWPEVHACAAQHGRSGEEPAANDGARERRPGARPRLAGATRPHTQWGHRSASYNCTIVAFSTLSAAESLEIKTQFLLIAILVAVGVPAASACTGIRIKPKDGSVIFARTLEFADDLQSNIIVIPRGKAFVGTAPGDKPGLPWKAKHGIVGANALGVPIIVDGLNEQGLAVGLFYFPGYAKYQEIKEADVGRAVAPWELRRLPPRQLPKRPGGGRSGPGRARGRSGSEGHGVRAAVPLHRQRCRRPLRGAGIRGRRTPGPRQSAGRNVQFPDLRLARHEPSQLRQPFRDQRAAGGSRGHQAPRLRTIHDGLAQQLAGAIVQFQTYGHLKDAKPGLAAKAFDAGMTMLAQGHSEARRLIGGVRPPAHSRRVWGGGGDCPPRRGVGDSGIATVGPPAIVPADVMRSDRLNAKSCIPAMLAASFPGPCR